MRSDLLPDRAYVRAFTKTGQVGCLTTLPWLSSLLKCCCRGSRLLVSLAQSRARMTPMARYSSQEIPALSTASAAFAANSLPSAHAQDDPHVSTLIGMQETQEQAAPVQLAPGFLAFGMVPTTPVSKLSTAVEQPCREAFCTGSSRMHSEMTCKMPHDRDRLLQGPVSGVLCEHAGCGPCLRKPAH